MKPAAESVARGKDAPATATGPTGSSPQRLEATRDPFRSRVRLLVVLVLCFAVLPGLLLIFVGVLVLVFGHQAHDYVFGTLILSLAATLIAGITATFLYVRRGTSLAKLQSEFVSRVSHDLRTPLTSIRMFVETLQSGRLQDPKKVDECLSVIAQETARLNTLVERLLTWARMEAGKRIYNPRIVDPKTFLEPALAAIEGQLTLARLDGTATLERSIDPDLQPVDVDPEAMTEALVNLLQNAIRFTGRDKHIGFAVRRDGAEMVITVSDNGPGIARDEQTRIFERFYRVVDPANPNIAGTGLGLPMVHHIVSAHDGRVIVESDLGKGAAFHIHLPLGRAATGKTETH